MIKSLFYPVIVALLFLVSCKSKKAPNSENDVLPVAVKTEKVQSTLMINEVSVSGNIAGTTTVKLGFMVAE